MERNNGGPAFPGEQGQTIDGRWNQTWESGMSLRDWLAGQALNGLISDPKSVAKISEIGGPTMLIENIAKIAYAAADTMLNVREII